MRIQEHEEVDAEAVREHVYVRHRHDNAIVLLQHRIESQCGGQRALRRPIPGWGKPSTLRGLSGFRGRW
jgi:hypothetical protein